MSSLHNILLRTDLTAPTIHESAGAMMRHYDKSAMVAVNEWRNAIQTCPKKALLPLVYVANEVLQNSKRNRGTKFLEAFAGVLGQTLVYIVQQDPSLIEKVRRVVKILGDRFIYSPRFCAEVLKGLEPYRNQNSNTSRVRTDPRSTPLLKSPSEAVGNPVVVSRISPSTKARPVTKLSAKSIDDLVALDNNHEEEDEDDDDESMALNDSDQDEADGGFLDGGNDSGLLDLNVDVSGALANNTSGAEKKGAKSSKAKRRRSSQGASSSKRRRSVLSTTSLVDLWNQVSTFSQSMETSMTILGGIQEQHLSTDNVDDSLVGDSLLAAYRKVLDYQKLVRTERVNLHKIANGRRSLEREAVRYIPWCRSALAQDEDDLSMCDKLEKEIKAIKRAQVAARKARTVRREKEALEKAKQEEERRKQMEEEERAQLLKNALKKQDVAEQGMVWNPRTQEYQYLETEESWRE